MTVAKPSSITLEEFLELPETKPASEYINGEIVQKPMPKTRHSRLQNKLIDAVNILHCLKYGCQLGWLVDPDDRSILVFQPNQQPELRQGKDDLTVLSGIEIELTVEEIFSWLKMKG